LRRLIKRTVDAFKPGLEDANDWDDQFPGFGLRVKPSGVKSYGIRYRTRTGGQGRVTLGLHGKLPPSRPGRWPKSSSLRWTGAPPASGTGNDSFQRYSKEMCR
jgi:Arm DNA-binding domain